MNAIPLKIECVGRVLIDLPQKSTKNRSQTFDRADVSRLPYSVNNENAFWSYVEQRKGALEHLPHETDPSQLGLYERVGSNAAILMFRGSDTWTGGYSMDRYLWLGGHGYQFKTDTWPNEIMNEVARYSEVFAKLLPRDNNAIPTSPGFCIDGALVTEEIGEITASVNFEVPGWKKVSMWIGTFEEAENTSATNIQEEDSLDAKLERERDAIRQTASEIPEAPNDPVYPKDFDVLRQHDRTLNGIAGRELIWRKRLNNGSALYTFGWQSNRISTPQRPNASIGMEVGDMEYPVVDPPKEEELFALWDAVLTSLKQRSGAY